MTEDTAEESANALEKLKKKNIGTAFEMYSTDWNGKYPTALSQLTPNYLKTIPECSAVGEIAYTVQTGTNIDR